MHDPERPAHARVILQRRCNTHHLRGCLCRLTLGVWVSVGRLLVRPVARLRRALANLHRITAAQHPLGIGLCRGRRLIRPIPRLRRALGHLHRLPAARDPLEIRWWRGRARERLIRLVFHDLNRLGAVHVADLDLARFGRRRIWEHLLYLVGSHAGLDELRLDPSQAVELLRRIVGVQRAVRHQRFTPRPIHREPLLGVRDADHVQEPPLDTSRVFRHLAVV